MPENNNHGKSEYEEARMKFYNKAERLVAKQVEKAKDQGLEEFDFFGTQYGIPRGGLEFFTHIIVKRAEQLKDYPFLEVEDVVKALES